MPQDSPSLEHNSLPFGQRLSILAGAALVLWLCFFWIAAPSERFNALLVPLWVLNFILSKKRLGKIALVSIGGVMGGVLGFYILGSIQAAQMSQHVSWWEPLQKVYFTAGLFVLYNVLCVVLNWLISLLPAGRALLKAPKGWWLRLIRVGVALILFAPYIYVSFNIHRFKYSSNTNPQTKYSLPFQTVDFAARDGVGLKGWFIPSTGSQRTIVVVHGIGANKGGMLPVVPFLHQAGFNLFLFDLRGHGESSGHTISFGVNEARDVEAAIDWVSQQPSSKTIGVLAYSMGGSSVLHAVGETGLTKVRAVALDSTFADFTPVVRGQMAFLPDSAAKPLMAIMSFYTRLEIGVGIQDIVPERYIGILAPRPLLLIHGTSDELIPFAQALENYHNARSPKSMYMVAGAGHCACYSVAGNAYEKRVAKFFKQALN